MKILGYLKKQPKWRLTQIDEIGFLTGWEGDVPRVYTGKQGWDERYEPTNEYEIDIPIIWAQLSLVGWGRGRSSATFRWAEQKHRLIYHTAMQTSFDMFKRSNLGMISGEFTFIKQGTQISLAPYVEAA